jgi:hypothetical protein
MSTIGKEEEEEEEEEDIHPDIEKRRRHIEAINQKVN